MPGLQPLNGPIGTTLWVISLALGALIGLVVALGQVGLGFALAISGIALLGLKYFRLSLRNWLLALVIISLGVPYSTLLAYRVQLGPVPFNILDVALLGCMAWLGTVPPDRSDKSAPSVWLWAQLFVLLLATLIGAFRGNDGYLVIREVRYLSLLVVAGFAAHRGIRSESDMKLMLRALIGAGLLSALLQYVHVARYFLGLEPQFRNIYIIGRSSVIAGLLILGAQVFKWDVVPKRVGNVLVGFLAIASVLSLERGLWLMWGLGIAMLLLLIPRPGRAATFAAGVCVIIAFGAVVGLGIFGGQQSNALTDLVSTRAQSLLTPFSSSNTIYFRWYDSQSLLKEIAAGNWAVGQGLGATVKIPVLGITGSLLVKTMDYTENAPLFHLWKAGLLGLVSILGLTAHMVQRMWRVRRVTPAALVCLIPTVGYIITGAASGAWAASQQLVYLGLMAGVAWHRFDGGKHIGED